MRTELIACAISKLIARFVFSVIVLLVLDYDVSGNGGYGALPHTPGFSVAWQRTLNDRFYDTGGMPMYEHPPDFYDASAQHEALGLSLFDVVTSNS